MNVLTLTGNLGSDCRTGNVSGTAVCNFSVAMKSGYGDKAQTIWVDCAIWGKQAESRLPEFLVKGQQVAVSGEMGTREHEGKTYITCRVQSMDLIGKRDEAQANQQQPQGGYQQPNHYQSAPQQPMSANNPYQKASGGTHRPMSQQAPQGSPAGAEPIDDFDDDIPF